MQITIVHRIEFAGLTELFSTAMLTALEARIVSQISDKIAELSASVDAAIGRVQDDVTALQGKIDELQAKVDSGGATQSDLDALDTLKAKLDALDPTTPAVLPPNP